MHFLWSVAASDSTFRQPSSVAVRSVGGRSAHVMVTDVDGGEVVILSASTGDLVGRVAGSSSRAGGFAAPLLVAASQSGALVGVYDAGRHELSLMNSQYQVFLRIPVEPPLVNPKDMVVFDDSSVAVSGGRLAGAGGSQAVHWSGKEGLVSSGPEGPPAMADQARQIAAGGPMRQVGGHEVNLADALTGSIWQIGRGTHRQVTPRLRVADAGTGERILHSSATPGEQVWWSFPRAVMIDQIDSECYLLLWSLPDERRVLLMAATATHDTALASWVESVIAAEPMPDGEGVILLGVGASGTPFVARATFPGRLGRLNGPMPDSTTRNAVCRVQ